MGQEILPGGAGTAVPGRERGRRGVRGWSWQYSYSRWRRRIYLAQLSRPASSPTAITPDAGGNGPGSCPPQGVATPASGRLYPGRGPGRTGCTRPLGPCLPARGCQPVCGATPMAPGAWPVPPRPPAGYRSSQVSQKTRRRCQVGCRRRLVQRWTARERRRQPGQTCPPRDITRSLLDPRARRPQTRPGP